MDDYRSMNVLHVYRTYFPETQGGLEETIRQICASTKPLGIASRVLSLAEAAYDTQVDDVAVSFARNQLEVASCGMGMGALKAHRALMDWADVVNYHFPWPFADVIHFAGKLFGRAAKKPSVITYHSDIVRQRVLGKLYEPLMHAFLSDVDAIVCTSENYLQSSDVLQKHKERVTVIPIGIAPDQVPKASEATLVDVEKRVGRDFFLFVGVLRYYKGLDVLIRAVQDTSLRVVIGGSGPLAQELAAQARELAPQNVSLLGRVTDEEKAALLTLCRAAVLPSPKRSEAFGVFLLEGAAASRPLISAEIGTGTTFVNEAEVTGIAVTPSDPASLRHAMERLADNPEVAKLMGQNARKRLEKLFTAAAMGARYHQLYASLLPKGGNRVQVG